MLSTPSKGVKVIGRICKLPGRVWLTSTRTEVFFLFYKFLLASLFLSLYVHAAEGLRE